MLTEPSSCRLEAKESGVGNFDITMDDFFAASQSSPTLQLNDVKSQSSTVFPLNDDDLGDDELLEAFNKHMESSSQTTCQISPVLVLTNRVASQHQPATLPNNDGTLPKFDLEFSFDDWDTANDDEKTTNVLETYVSFDFPNKTNE